MLKNPPRSSKPLIYSFLSYDFLCVFSIHRLKTFHSGFTLLTKVVLKGFAMDIFVF